MTGRAMEDLRTLARKLKIKCFVLEAIEKEREGKDGIEYDNTVTGRAMED